MLTTDQVKELQHWFNELVAFMTVQDLQPVALLTMRTLPGGRRELGAIECRFRRYDDDTLRACGRVGVEGLINARKASEGRLPPPPPE